MCTFQGNECGELIEIYPISVYKLYSYSSFRSERRVNLLNSNGTWENRLGVNQVDVQCAVGIEGGATYSCVERLKPKK